MAKTIDIKPLPEKEVSALIEDWRKRMKRAERQKRQQWKQEARRKFFQKALRAGFSKRQAIFMYSFTKMFASIYHEHREWRA